MQPVPYLDDRYELRDVLGRGSFATVYAAYDRKLGIPVAVKVMHEELRTSKRLVDAFTREAAIVTRAASPHIVKALGLAVTATGAPCIVYEHLEGETLGARIERTGGLTVAATVHVVEQIARALARVHGLGMVHRDVKPENVFLVDEPGGRPLVKLIDFGLAELVTGAPFAIETAGTPEYMPPEVVCGFRQADARADVYALGAVAFECLTGETLFGGETVSVVLAAVRVGRRPSIADVRPELGGALDAWLDRAVHPDPEMRYASAKNLASALRSAVQAPRERVAEVAFARAA